MRLMVINGWWYGKEEGYNMTEMGTDIWMSAAGDVWPDLYTIHKSSGYKYRAQR